MLRKSLLWCAVVVTLFGCGAEGGSDTEPLERERLAHQRRQNPMTCTISGEFARQCRDRGGVSTCDDTTAMCCKTTRDENGNPSTFCSSRPEEVRLGPPEPSTPVLPSEPIFEAAQ